MSRFSTSGSALATAANTNVISFRSTASQRVMLEEIGLFAEAATALAASLFLTTVVDTAGTAVALQKDDPGAGTASITCVTGPTGGTLAGTASRRAHIPAVIGAGIVWAWPTNDGLLVPLSLSLVVRNAGGAAGPAITWYASLREV